MKISFHGADRDVTGSCHLVECAGKRILIDCGLYQGSRELVEENSDDFGFDPGSIDFLLVTHAHLDHCGRIPLLSKRGFRGEIITTAASRELMRLVMLDSAHLQEEEASYHARRRARHGHRSRPAPLYRVLDALNSTEHFGRTAVYRRPLQLAPGIRATFFDAGHILGSASIYLELEEHGHRRTVLFSGDLGNSHSPLLEDPSIIRKADVLLMESTYGDREHVLVDDEVIARAIRDAASCGGVVIIPAFAVDRTEVVLWHLDQLAEQHIVELDDERRAAMVSNLLVVLCSDRHTQPVVNTGSLYT